MGVESARGFRADNQSDVRDMHSRATAATMTATAPVNRIVVRLPCRFLGIIARSILLALVIATLPWISSVVRSPEANYIAARPKPIDDIFFMPMLFEDLSDLGLLRPEDHAAYVGEPERQRLQFLTEREMDVISERNADLQRSISADTFDFLFADGFAAEEFIDRTLKIGGVVAIQLNADPWDAFRVPTNYKIVYIQHFEATVVALRKIGGGGGGGGGSSSSKEDGMKHYSSTSRKLLSIPNNTRKAALNSLEDVLLEPPRAASAHSSRFMRKTKYLPDLTGDSLDEYPRRVFIDVGTPDKGSSTVWFNQHYPTRNRYFETYKVEMVAEGLASSVATQPIEMSDWLKINVKEEEYVVMKAEAGVVEEMVKSQAIYLVDELFLECKHQGQKGNNKEKSKRAYWECLALYGKLKDGGVAVHQWWG